MRLRYSQFLGKTVQTAEGRALGRVHDLVAERRGDWLCVTALLVGPSVLVRRIAFKRGFLHSRAPLRIPWEGIARVDEAITLRPGAERSGG